MEEDMLQKSLLIIGAGGIGTTVVDLGRLEARGHKVLCKHGGDWHDPSGIP
mgnify:CR=1 FL=1